jgi:hypothetical protein
MATRIGRYIFDIDLEKMDIEKLKVLKEGCEHFIKEKHREEIHRALTEINLRAHAYGFDIWVEPDVGDGVCLNEYTMKITDREVGG